MPTFDKPLEIWLLPRARARAAALAGAGAGAGAGVPDVNHGVPYGDGLDCFHAGHEARRGESSGFMSGGRLPYPTSI